MATRNLTAKYEAFRSSIIRSKPKTNTQAALLSGDSDSSAGLNYVLPPQWVDIVESVQSDIKTIKELFVQLNDHRNARLRITFGQDEAVLDRDIEIVSSRITSLLKKSENGVKRIATVSNERGASLPERERVVRLNVMRALGAELRDLSTGYRTSQKAFLSRLRGQDNVGKEFFGNDMNDNDTSLDEALDRGMSDEELQQLTQLNQNASAREREIVQIATSINDLASLFNELSVLVLEQGTVLDRIDYNVEQTLVKVGEGVEELQKAEEHSKKAYTMKFILFLICVIIVLTLILIFQHVNFSGNSENSGN